MTGALSLDDLAAYPERVSTLTTWEIHAAVLKAAAVLAVLAGWIPCPPVLEAPDEPLLTVQDVAARLQFAPSYVYELIRLGRLSAVREGKYVRIRPAVLRTWVLAHEAIDSRTSVTYSLPDDRRRVASAAPAPKTHTTRASRAGRRSHQLDRASGTGRTRNQGTLGTAGSAPGQPVAESP
jgi:excisionase family DNA binding protein